MKVSLPAGLKLTFIGAPRFRLHASSSLGPFVPVREGRWSEALASAASADVTFLFLDGQFEPAAARRLGGIKVGVVSAPPRDGQGSWPLSMWTKQAGLTWLTWFEPGIPPSVAEELPILQVLPMPLDTAQFPMRPDYAAARLVVPEWASPPETALARLEPLMDIVTLRADLSPERWPEVLRDASVVLYANGPWAARMDPFPLVALAHGALLVTSALFPRAWNIEVEDEYLFRGDDAFVQVVDEAVRIPETTRAVRMRALQKVRELYDASSAWARAAHDALAFSDVRRLLAPVGRLRAAGDRT